MFTIPALAQTASPGGAADIISTMVPLVLIMAVFWFLLIRPQQKRAKEHAELVSNVRRGDNIVTSGGMIGKISKVIDDNEVMVELAEGVKIKMIKSAISEVRVKGQPVKADDKKAK